MADDLIRMGSDPPPAPEGERPQRGGTDPTGSHLSDAEWLAWARRVESPVPLGPLGSYELLAEIGRGAQGRVYRARQPGTRREVVIKRLAAGAFATPRMRARFEREIEALGSLHHPNIVTVHATEVIDQQPILVMEWVEGQSVDRWVAEGSGAPPQPNGQPPPHRPVREILEMFVRVCDAVHHAHQHGVIHRDLKPSNILVDGTGEPRVLDFGLAILCRDGDQNASHTADFVGTPAYASPEQLRGERQNIDTRSDVYSLGVILYQLLTGVWPHAPPGRSGAGPSLAETFDFVLRNDPPRPSALHSGLGREIDAIVLKAMAKNPAERYQSADALRSDLRRFLAGQTVLAHPPTRLYQFRKLVRRNRAAFALGTGVAAIVLSAAVVSTVLAVRLVRQRDQLAVAQIRERQERQRATAEADKLAATHSILLALLTGGDAADAFAPDVDLRQLMDEAVKTLDDGALRDQPAVDAAIRVTLARVYLALTLPRKAEEQARRALVSRTADPGPGTREYAEALTVLASSVHELGRYAESEVLRRQSLELHRSFYGEESLETIRQKHSLVSVLRDQRKLVEGELLARQALQTAIRLTGQRSLETAEARLRLGWLLSYGDLQESEKQIREALAIREALRGHDDMLVADCLLRLGRTLQSAGNYEGGKAALLEAVRISRDVRGHKHPGTLRYMNYQIALLEGGREYEAAEETCRQTLAGWQSYPGIYDERVAGTMASLARIRGLRGDTAGAEELHRRALEQLRAGVGEAHPVTARQWWTFAGFFAQHNRLAEAEAILNEALEGQRASLGDAHELVAGSLEQLARILERQGRREECERARTQAIEIRRATLGDDDETVIKWIWQLTGVIAAAGQPERAASVIATHAQRLRPAIEAATGTPREASVVLAYAQTLRLQARLHCEQGNFESCETLARASIAAAERESDLPRLRVAWADGHYCLGLALLGRRQYAEAESALLECHRTYARQRVEGRWPRYLRQQLVRLYEEWEAAEPGAGHAAQAADWRARLEAATAALSPESQESGTDP